jgi:hypothetical protein
MLGAIEPLDRGRIMIVFPALYCPIPSASSPYGATAERDVLDWLDKFELSETRAQHA